MFKKFLFAILFAASTGSILFTSCSTDVELLEEYKPITVVYGLLNKQESVQYIKVNKAFLGEGDATIMAQQSDSINYQPGEVDVKLQRINPSTGQVIQTISCNDTTGILKDDGTFASPYQLLFYTNAALDAASRYRLEVRRHEDDALITATTAIVGDVAISTPATTISLYNSSMSTYTDATVKWNAATNAKVYDVVVRFTYYQNQISPPGPVDTLTLDYNLGSVVDVNTSPSFTLKLESEGYFQFLKNSVNSDNNLLRVANDSLTVIVTAGTEDLYTYVLVNQPSIGLIQERPVFTNINEGAGIFSSRLRVVKAYKMTTGTLDELHNGQYTGHLF
jgi:hypothetical protein